MQKPIIMTQLTSMCLLLILYQLVTPRATRSHVGCPFHMSSASDYSSQLTALLPCHRESSRHHMLPPHPCTGQPPHPQSCFLSATAAELHSPADELSLPGLWPVHGVPAPHRLKDTVPAGTVLSPSSQPGFPGCGESPHWGGQLGSRSLTSLSNGHFKRPAARQLIRPSAWTPGMPLLWDTALTWLGLLFLSGLCWVVFISPTLNLRATLCDLSFHSLTPTPCFKGPPSSLGL